MAREPRYDILFEPLRIGPVTAKNRAPSPWPDCAVPFRRELTELLQETVA